MQQKVTFYANELSHFLSGKECKKSSCPTKIATEDTYNIKHCFKFFLPLIYSNTMAEDEFNQKICPRVTPKTIFWKNWAKRKKKDFFTWRFVQPNFSKQSSKARVFHKPEDIHSLWKTHSLVLGCARKPARTAISDHILWENMGSEF